MSEERTIAEGRLALARDNIEAALSDLGAVRARVAELAFCDDEWNGYIGGVFDGQERLLREALRALS